MYLSAINRSICVCTLFNDTKISSIKRILQRLEKVIIKMKRGHKYRLGLEKHLTVFSMSVKIQEAVHRYDER